jgi:hypothetical protein
MGREIFVPAGTLIAVKLLRDIVPTVIDGA